jgi:uncharacterized protein
MSEDNVATVRGLYEAFAKGDVDSVLAGFDENIEWNESQGMPYGGQYNSPQEVAENIFAPIANDWDDFSVEPERILAEDDLVVVLLTYRGKGKETGKDLLMPAAHTWIVRDGKVTKFQQLADSAIMNEALGAKAPA